VGELSGGERRRLALMRLLMRGPNVLLLDEPTNDLDVDTLTALEDLLDGWPGTLVVVSHDRYFVERVCDNVYAITETGGIRHLPGGIDQYISERHTAPVAEHRSAAGAGGPPAGTKLREARKDAKRAGAELRRLEATVERLARREAALAELMHEVASDHARLAELQSELEEIRAEREATEMSWLEAADAQER